MSVYRDFYGDLVYAQTFGSENNAWLPDEESPAIPAVGTEVFIDLSKFRNSPLVESFFTDDDWITGDAAGFALRVLVGGGWKTVSAISILVAGEWKSVQSTSVLIDGVWKS